jgi:hypothetical protein
VRGKFPRIRNLKQRWLKEFRARGRVKTRARAPAAPSDVGLRDFAVELS